MAAFVDSVKTILTVLVSLLFVKVIVPDSLRKFSLSMLRKNRITDLIAIL